MCGCKILIRLIDNKFYQTKISLTLNEIIL